MTLAEEQIEITAPAPWLTSIGAICDAFGGDVQTGPFGSQLHASDYTEEGTPVVMPQDMAEGQIVCDRIARVSKTHVRKLQRHVLHAGDIVFSRRGDVTRFAVVTEREAGWLCGTGSIRIRLNCPDILVDYARRYLQQETVGQWLVHRAQGVTMPNLNTGVVRSLPFVYPPLPEQRRIVEVLDRAETLRAQRRQALAQLDALAEAIFLALFARPESGGWPRSTIGAVATKLRTGPFGSQLLHSEFVESGVAVLGIDNVVKNEFAWAQPRFISESKFKQLERYRVAPGDVLITIMGTCGRCAIVPDDVPVAINTKHICCVTLDRSQCLPSYLHAVLLMHPEVLHRLGVHERGAVMPGLNMQLIRDLEVPLPPAAAQQQFHTAMQVIKSQKESMTDSLSSSTPFSPPSNTAPSAANSEVAAKSGTLTSCFPASRHAISAASRASIRSSGRCKPWSAPMPAERPHSST